MEKELVKEKIREKVETFSGKKILDDENLLDSSAEIPVNSWLYIFDELEKELGIEVYDIFKIMECTDFSIEGIAKYISELTN